MQTQPGQKYVFRILPGNDLPLIKGARDADPQVIGEILARITERDQGKLKPRAVVTEARDADNPLHRHFEWDDRVAGEQHRLAQARSLIHCIQIIPQPALKTTVSQLPAFLNIRKDNEGNAQSYRPLSVVLNSYALQRSLLDAAARDLRAWEARYRVFTDLCDMVRQVRAAIEARLPPNGESPQ